MSQEWFTDQAIEQSEKTVEVFNSAMPISGQALAKGVEWLKMAERVRIGLPLVPQEMEERHEAMLSRFGYGLDLPWSVTAIEYEHAGVYDVRQDYTRALSTRRIALCVAIENENRLVLKQEEGGAAKSTGVIEDVLEKREKILEGQEGLGSLLVWPVTWFDEKREWEFCPGVAIIPRMQAGRELALAANPYLAAAFKVEARIREIMGRSFEDSPMMVKHQLLMPELCDKLGQDHAEKTVHESTLDAVWVALGAFNAMACHNVLIEGASRELCLEDPSGVLQGESRIRVDPFRGARKVNWRGVPIWDQSFRADISALKKQSAAAAMP